MNDQTETATPRPQKVLQKALPTDRVSYERQLGILRAYAAASGPERRGVTNDDVEKVYGDLKSNSISLCNAFFVDVGLLAQDGRKLRPSDAVFDYQHAYEWNPDSALLKLNRLFVDTWAAKALLPRLSFRQLSKDEAISVLADESKATKGHRRNLEILLDFLSGTGVVKVEGNEVRRGAAMLTASTPVDTPAGTEVVGVLQMPPLLPPLPPARPEPAPDTEQFTVPIPGKPAAIITVPKGLDAEDWEMLSQMIGMYIKRLQRRQALRGSSEGDTE